jgi:hypothetical protein
VASVKPNTLGALEEQAGLKLDSKRVEFVVIDRAEGASAN